MPYYRLVRAENCCSLDIVTYFNLDFQPALVTSQNQNPIENIFNTNYVFSAETYHNQTTRCWKTLTVYDYVDDSYPYIQSQLYKKCDDCTSIIPCKSVFKTKICNLGNEGPLILVEDGLPQLDSNGEYIVDGTGNVFNLSGECLYISSYYNISPPQDIIEITSFEDVSCSGCEVSLSYAWRYVIYCPCCNLDPLFAQPYVFMYGLDNESHWGDHVFVNNSCCYIVSSVYLPVEENYPFYYGEYYSDCYDCQANNLTSCDLYFRTLRCSDGSLGPLVSCSGSLLSSDSQGDLITDGSANVFTYNNDCYHIYGIINEGQITIPITEFIDGSCEDCLTTDIQYIYRLYQGCCEYLPYYGETLIVQGPEGGIVGQYVNINNACWAITNVSQTSTPLSVPYYYGNFITGCDTCLQQSGFMECEFYFTKIYRFANCCTYEPLFVEIPNSIIENFDSIVGLGINYLGECYGLIGAGGGADADIFVTDPSTLIENYCQTKECVCPTPTPTPFLSSTPITTQPVTPPVTPTLTMTPSKPVNLYLCVLRGCCEEDDAFGLNIIFEFGTTPQLGWSIAVNGNCYYIQSILGTQIGPGYDIIQINNSSIYSGNTSPNNCIECKNTNNFGCQTDRFLNCNDGLVYKIVSFDNGVNQYGSVGNTYVIYINEQLDVDSGCFTAVDPETQFSWILFSDSPYTLTSGCKDINCYFPTPTPTTTNTMTPTNTPSLSISSTVTQTPSKTYYTTPTPTLTLTQTSFVFEDYMVLNKFVLCCAEPFDCSDEIFEFNNKVTPLSSLFGLLDGTTDYISSTLDNTSKMFTFIEDGDVSIGSGSSGPRWTGYFENNLNFNLITDNPSYAFYQDYSLGDFDYTPSYNGIDWGPSPASITNFLASEWYYNTTINKAFYVRYNPSGVSNSCLLPNEAVNLWTWTTYNPSCFTPYGDPNSNDSQSNGMWSIDRCFGALCSNDYWNQMDDYGSLDCVTFKTISNDLDNDNIGYIVDGWDFVEGETKFIKTNFFNNKSSGIRSKCGFDDYIHEVNISLSEYPTGEFSIVIGMYKDIFGDYGEKDVTYVLEMRYNISTPEYFEVRFNKDNSIHSFRNPSFINDEGDFYFPGIIDGELSHDSLVRRFVVPNEYQLIIADYFTNVRYRYSSRLRIIKNLNIYDFYITKPWEDFNTFAGGGTEIILDDPVDGSNIGDIRDYYHIGSIDLLNPEVGTSSTIKQWADKTLLTMFIYNTKWGYKVMNHKDLTLHDIYFSGSQKNCNSVIYRPVGSTPFIVDQTYSFDNIDGCWRFDGTVNLDDEFNTNFNTSGISGPLGSCDECSVEDSSTDNTPLSCNFTESLPIVVPGSSGKKVFYINVNIGESLGEVVIDYNSLPGFVQGGFVNRVQLLLGNNIVADTTFFGDNLNPNLGNTEYYENLILGTNTYDRYDYIGGPSLEFVQNGTETHTFNLDDICPFIPSGRSLGSVGNQIGVVANFPSPFSSSIHGRIKLSFNKTQTSPTVLTIRVFAPELDNFQTYLYSVTCPEFAVTPNPTPNPTQTPTLTPSVTPSKNGSFTRFIHIPNL